MTTPVLSARQVQKRFSAHNGETIQALEALDLEISENGFVCIVGPSGCGKSTFLRMAAGLEPVSEGAILYRGQTVLAPRREVGMVFQEYSLLPWRTVKGNVALGPEFSGKSRAEQNAAARKYLELVALEDFAHVMPHELSGGMRQRVAIARALANEPDVLLMDEPFGALDAHTRILLQKELLRIWRQHKTTILFVTHCVDEAVYLADKIVVMTARPGRIQAVIPVDLPHPRNRAEPAYAKLTASILDMLDSGNNGASAQPPTARRDSCPSPVSISAR